MLDCFISLNPINELRYGMAIASIAQWRTQPVSIFLLIPSGFNTYFWNDGWGKFPQIRVRGEFQVERRRVADQLGSSLYILADDDCLFLGDVKKACELMESYTEFAILSAMPTNHNINFWMPEAYDPSLDGEVMEHVSVGGIRFCRKNSLKCWPPLIGLGYDMAQCTALRREGKRVGYMRNQKMNHLGEGASTVWTHSPQSSSPSGLRSSLRSSGQSI